MNEGELARRLTKDSPWWKDPAGWHTSDRDLRAAADAAAQGFVYEPDPLADVAPSGLYWLRGPRRVGKTLELKRLAKRLVEGGVSPRRIIHCACDGMDRFDLAKLVQVGRDILTTHEKEPRYWLLDEITAVDGWPAELKGLRDSTALADDCVVITGSTNRDYAEARKELGGREGSAVHPYRVLLPMSFRRFVLARQRLNLPQDIVEIDQLRDPLLARAVYELEPWMNELFALWEIYLQVGGYPRAVLDHMLTGNVSGQFTDHVWSAILGEVMASTGASETETHGFVAAVARRLSGPMNLTGLTHELGLGKTTYTAKSMTTALTNAFVIWPCYQQVEGRPNRNAYPKIYFFDPLPAHLPYIRSGADDPTASALTEQAIGVSLLRANERRWPGTLGDFADVMYLKTATRSEIDFVGPHFGIPGVEGKYVDTNTQQEAMTLMAQFRSGILATKTAVDLSRPVLDVPASFLAYLLG